MADQKITALTAETVLEDADIIPVVVDVATTPITKKSTFTLLKSFLKTYFDILYAAIAQTMYIGTTAHAINRASASEGLAGITSLTPGANFTLSQNAVNAFTSEETGAIVNTLYLKAGNVGIGTTSPQTKLALPSGSAISFEASAGVTDIAITHTADTLTFTGGTIALGTATATGGLTGNVTGTASGNLVSGGALGTPSSGTATNITGLPVSGIVASTVTALGVGSIELGHATDTTLSRVSAGVVAIEGVNIVTTSSTDTLTNKTLTSPTLTTPALGTPASGVMTNVIGLPTTGLVDDAVTLAKMAAGTAGNLITYDASGNPAYVATGTVNQVLTSNGAGAAPTFQNAAGGAVTPRITINTNFEGEISVTAPGTRYEKRSTGTGVAVIEAFGCSLKTGTTINSYIELALRNTMGNVTLWSIFTKNPMSTWISKQFISTTDMEGTLFTSNVSTASITVNLTKNHYGFYFRATANGATKFMSASNAQGTTETSTDISAVFLDNVFQIYTAFVTDGTNIKYYVDTILRATHTTNLPTAIDGDARYFEGWRTNDDAADSQFQLASFSYSRDAF